MEDVAESSAFSGIPVSRNSPGARISTAEGVYRCVAIAQEWCEGSSCISEGVRMTAYGLAF